MKNKEINKVKQNVEIGLNINWFPGHMKKGIDEINKIIKNIDLIIEVVDARAINSSSNDELIKIANNKLILKIALKSDYSTLNSNEIIVGSARDKKLRNKIIDAIYKKLEPKFSSYQKKGIINPKFLILIMGLPNVGKSTLINLLKNKNTLITENLPGVTKKQRLVSINKHLNLIDTPGILLKHISDIKTAYKLVLINCIKKEIVPLHNVLEYGFNHFFINHKDELINYYKINDFNNYNEFINLLSKKRNWYNAKNEIDYNRLETHLFNDFSQAKICKTNFDK